MSGFTLHLQDARQTETIGNVTCFVGEDESGSFGILPGRERLMTSLVFGLARYRLEDGTWQYVAMPGALAYFINDELFVSTRRYVRDADYGRITGILNAQLLQEEENLRGMKTSLDRMEEEMMKRLWQMGRGAGGAA